MLVPLMVAALALPQPEPEFHWRLIGPFRAGLATAVTGVPGEPATFYFGGAGGGVWKTTDAGNTWHGLLQHERASSIGALAVAPSAPRILYAGTGQVDVRYDLMAGEGMYRSSDGGESWTPAGLERTRHIAAILIDPRDPDRVLVAALGHVFAANPERGVFLTRDGGRHWQPVLQPGDSVGAIDLACDPLHPAVVYAATWQMRMHPWLDYFQPQVGAGSGIYRSDDAGLHWRRLGGGLPEGAVGRIGLAVPRGSGGRIVYACVAMAGGTSATPAATGKPGLYRSEDAGATWALVNPTASLGSSYFGRVIAAPDDPRHLYAMGVSILESHDGGARFTVARGSPGGDDYHALWIDPADPRRRIAGSDQGAAVSLDGGATWSSWYNQPTGQFYHLAADDGFPYHLYSGQQDNGTVEIASRGPYGVIEERDWHPVGGDERDFMVPKPGHPELVFGSGLGATVSRFDERTHQTADVSPWPISSYGAKPTTVRYRSTWITPLVFSPVAPHAMYLGTQVLFRSLDDGAHWQVVSPDLSGKTSDLPPGADPDPLEARARGFGVIFSIAPSPVARDRIWVGTDDGRVRLTTDGGRAWRDVTPAGIPPWGIVSSIEPSPLDPGVAYVAVDTHRLDRFEPLAFRTTDSGATWTRITRGIPGDEFVAVVRTDRVRRGLLYAGTDRRVYVSFDDGDDWQPLAPGLPTTWMRDLLPHEDDLAVATQGRGIWVLDDLAPLRELAAGAASEPLHLFAPPPAVRLRGSESHDTPWPPETPLGANPPTGAVIDYWLGGATRGPVTLTIRDAGGRMVRRFASDDAPESLAAAPSFEPAWTGEPRRPGAGPGMHRFVWDLRYAHPPARSFHYTIAAVRGEGTPIEPRGPFVLPGRYTVTLEADGGSRSRTLVVKLDPRVVISNAALIEQLRLSQAIDSTLAGAWREHDTVVRAGGTRTGTLPAALADSLTQLADRGNASLAGVAAVLARLAEAVQLADTGPSQGQREVFVQCERRVTDLATRWRNLEARLGEGTNPGTRH